MVVDALQIKLVSQGSFIGPKEKVAPSSLHTSLYTGHRRTRPDTPSNRMLDTPCYTTGIASIVTAGSLTHTYTWNSGNELTTNKNPRTSPIYSYINQNLSKSLMTHS